MSLTDLRERCEATVINLLREPMQLVPERSGQQGEHRMFRLLAGDTETSICVQVRNRVRPLELAQVIGRFPVDRCDYRMLFTDYVSDSLAIQLRTHRIWFADTLGNIFMEIPGKLLLYKTGQRPRRVPAPTGQHFSAPGAKVLHTLLKHGPDIQATYRDMRQATGVSIDKIGKLIRELEQKALLRVHGSGHYEIRDADMLLNLWIDAYGAKLRPALFLNRCAAAEGRQFADLIRAAGAALDGQVIVGGEVAADQLTRHLRATHLRLYIPDDQVSNVRRQLKLAPSASGAIELCKLYSDDIAGDQTYKGAALADAAFVYAELMTTDDDRLAETAMRLRQEHLAWTL